MAIFSEKKCNFCHFLRAKIFMVPGLQKSCRAWNKENFSRSLDCRAQNSFGQPGTLEKKGKLFSTNFERTTPLFAILAKKLAFFLEGSRHPKVVLSTGIERSQKVLLKTRFRTSLRPREPQKFLASKMAFFRFSVFVKFLKKVFFRQRKLSKNPISQKILRIPKNFKNFQNF